MKSKKLKLAVLGSPIKHSRSPMLQAKFAKDCGFPHEDFSYERIEVTESELGSVVKRLVFAGYDGFNCTMPLKTEMSYIADELDEESKILSSVNTVSVRGGKLYAYTTDGIGILMTIRRGFALGGRDGETIKGKRVLLMGAGGAARSAALSLKRAGAELTICNRTIESAVSLSAMLGGDPSCIALSDGEGLRTAASRADILINCTSLGMSGKAEFENFDFLAAMKKGAIVIDAVYNPIETELLKRASAMGFQALSGLWMLVYQGAAAFEKWTGIFPDEKSCLEAFELIKE